MAIGRTKSETEYRRLLAEQARSGKTVREFAEERGLPVHRFWWWKGEIRRRDAARGRAQKKARREQAARISEETEPQFLPVRLLEAAPAPQPERVEQGSSGSGYELALGRGRVLRLPSDFDPTRAAALVRALEAAC